MALVKVYGLEFLHISNKAEEKRIEKGGFEEKIYSDFIEIEENNPNLKYYRVRPDSYPEIK